MSLPSGKTLDHFWNGFGEVTGVDIDGNGTADVSVTRDAIGIPTSLQDSTGTRAFNYPSAIPGLLESVSWQGGIFGGRTLQLPHEPELLRSSGYSVHGDGQTLASQMIDAYWLVNSTKPTEFSSGNDLQCSVAYEESGQAMGRLIKRTCAYDNLGRLASMSYAYGDTPPHITTSQTFSNERTHTMAFNEAGMQESVTYGYDMGKDVLASVRSQVNYEGTTFTLPGGQIDYAYDGMQNRVSQTDLSVDFVADSPLKTTTSQDFNDLNQIASVSGTGTTSLASLLEASPSADVQLHYWDASTPVVRSPGWTGTPLRSESSDTTFAEFMTRLPASGQWRLEIDWPQEALADTQATGAVRVLVEVDDAERIVVTQPKRNGTGTSLVPAVSGAETWTLKRAGKASVRVLGQTTGRVYLPEAVRWVFVPQTGQATRPAVTVPALGTIPEAQLLAASRIERSGRYLRALVPAPANHVGPYAWKVAVNARLVDAQGKVHKASESRIQRGVAGGSGGATGHAPQMDPDGNITNIGQLSNITWDSQQRNLSLDLADGRDVDYLRDAEGRIVRYRVSNNGAIERERRTTWVGMKPVLDEEYGDSNRLLVRREYIWGPDLDGSQGGMGHVGGLLAVREFDNATGANRTYAVVCDTHGHVRALLDPDTGKTVANYSYDPFGRPLEEVGPARESCPFRWNTRRWESETGLYDFGFRHYEPAAATWLTREPLGESAALNLYAYCGNDPVNNYDFLGLEKLRIEGDDVYWIIQKNLPDWRCLGYNSDVREILIGRKVNDMVYLSPEFGGGVVFFEYLEEATSNFWINRADMSGQGWKTQNEIIRLVLRQIHRGESLDSDYYFTAVVLKPGVQGLGTGGKVVVNSAASTVCGFLTLGMCGDIVLIEPTAADYAIGYAGCRTGCGICFEFVAGAGIGKLATLPGKFATAGKAAFVLDTTGNAVTAVRGGVNIYQTGELNWSNGLQLGGGLFGFTGNVTGRYGDEIGDALGKWRSASESRLAPFMKCFPAGTLVLMADGSAKPIEEIKEGDEVMADDPGDNAPASARKVTHLLRNWTECLVNVAVDKDGDSKADGEIKATGEHPFWTSNRGWIAAKDLKSGDVLQAADGAAPTVVSADSVPTTTDTFNLTVDGTHTYFAFADDIPLLVHNAEPISLFDVRPYADFAKFPFDGLDGHEMLQKSWLENNGFIKFRPANPSLALEASFHRNIVNKFQAGAGLWDAATTTGQSAYNNIRANIRVLESAGVPRDVIARQAWDAKSFANSLPCP